MEQRQSRAQTARLAAVQCQKLSTKRRKGEREEVQQESTNTTVVKKEKTDGWNEEDHQKFVEIAKEGEWEMEDPFLKRVQERLPHMIHSEIIDHRRWLRISEGSNLKRRKTETAKAEAMKIEEADESDYDKVTDEEGEVKKKFGVLTAKARINYEKKLQKAESKQAKTSKEASQTKMGSCRIVLRSYTENTPAR